MSFLKLVVSFAPCHECERRERGNACKIQNRARRTRRCDQVRTFRYQLPTVQATGDVAVRNDPVAQRMTRLDDYRDL
jgi:hypothetical protein